MKRLIFLFLMMLSLGISAQTLKPITAGGFNVESGERSQTEANITIDGKTFEVFESRSGSKYVKSVSKKGKPYPVWIGEASDVPYQGKKTRIYKSGTYGLLYLNKNGYPSVKWLRAE